MLFSPYTTNITNMTRGTGATPVVILDNTINDKGLHIDTIAGGRAVLTNKMLKVKNAYSWAMEKNIIFTNTIYTVYNNDNTITTR